MKKQEKLQDHAVLAPSASVRWLHCPASVNLPQEEQKDTRAADEGTLAHKMCELKIKDELGKPWITYEEQIEDLRQDELYKDEMDGFTAEYAKEITDRQREHLYIETKVNVKDHKEVYGTSDCILINSENEITVIDFKYGFGFVNVEDNPQLKIYSLGAVNLAEESGDIILNDDLIINNEIYQPRINNYGRTSYTYGELKEWRDTVLLPALAKVKDSPELICEGEWCKYCKAKKACHDRQNKPVKTEINGSILDLYGDMLADAEEDLKRAQERYDNIKTRVEKIIKTGAIVTGYKLVQGNRKQEWSDEKKVKNLSVAEDLDLFELISPAQAKKRLGKERFEKLLGELTTTKRNKPVLVKETDRRKALEFKDK